MVLYVTQLLSVMFLTGKLLGDTILVHGLQFYVDMKN